MTTPRKIGLFATILICGGLVILTASAWFTHFEWERTGAYSRNSFPMEAAAKDLSCWTGASLIVAALVWWWVLRRSAPADVTAPVSMIEPPNYISGFQRVLDAYGYWPSFHDSPVLRYHKGSDHIELDLEAWEMTPEVDSRGYFVLTKRHEIGFRFSRILTAEMNQFSLENTLLEVEFSPASDYDSRGVFNVSLISAIEGSMCGSFTAACGEVLFIRPTVPQQSS
jgi:hypothetical protein